MLFFSGDGAESGDGAKKNIGAGIGKKKTGSATLIMIQDLDIVCGSETLTEIS